MSNRPLLFELTFPKKAKRSIYLAHGFITVICLLMIILLIFGLQNTSPVFPVLIFSTYGLFSIARILEACSSKLLVTSDQITFLSWNKRQCIVIAEMEKCHRAATGGLKGPQRELLALVFKDINKWNIYIPYELIYENQEFQKWFWSRVPLHPS